MFVLNRAVVPTELSSPENVLSRLSDFSSQTLLLIPIYRPLHLLMQIYYLFIALGTHHDWPYIMCFKVTCHKERP